MRTKASRKNPEGLERYGLYRCYACGKTFTVRAGTIFEHSHLALHSGFRSSTSWSAARRTSARARSSTAQLLDEDGMVSHPSYSRVHESPGAWERGRHETCDLRARGASLAPLNRKAASHRTKQARRFKKLAKDVGADELPEGFADAVHKLAAAGPVSRKPLKARPQSRAIDGAGLTGSYEEEQARVTCPAGRGCSGSGS